MRLKSMVFGRRGILLAGPNVMQYDMVINAILMLLSLDMFLQCFFQRCFTLSNTLSKIREMINYHTKDPSSVRLYTSNQDFSIENEESHKLRKKDDDILGRAGAAYKATTLTDICGHDFIG